MSNYIKQKVENKVVLDTRTGEITDLFVNRKVDINDFIMVFFDSIPELHKLKPTEYKTLMEIWKHSNYVKNYTEQGNVFINDASFKMSCKRDGLNYTNNNINSYISSLVKKGILIRVNRGRYVLNPKYFFKGTLNDRMRAIINIQYIDGFSVTTITPVE